jgi:hypothetical protein
VNDWQPTSIRGAILVVDGFLVCADADIEPKTLAKVPVTLWVCRLFCPNHITQAGEVSLYSDGH